MDNWFKKYKYVASLTGFIIIVFLSYVPFIIAESLKDNPFSLLAISSLVFSSILLLLYHQYFYKRTAKEFFGVLRYLLIGEVGGLIGLIGFLSEFVLSSLAEYIKNITNENLMKDAGLAITTFLNMFSVGFTFVYFFDKQLQIRPSKGREPRSVLIFALSKPGDITKRDDRNNKCKIVDDLPGNYIPICELLEFHKDALNEMHVLYSRETIENKEKRDGLKYLDKILYSLEIYDKIKIYPYKCDFNDEESIKEQIIKINIEIKKYEDREISIYISGGTSLITAILTLLGLERDRQIEYITQGSSQIKAIEISKDDTLLFLKTLALK
jgi:hypothetical protein